MTEQDRGRAIAAMRRRMGLSKRELAKGLDVSPSTIVRWERNGAPVIAELAVRTLAEKAPAARLRLGGPDIGASPAASS